MVLEGTFFFFKHYQSQSKSIPSDEGRKIVDVIMILSIWIIMI